MNYILFLLAGIIVLNLFRFNEAWGKPDFSWKYYAKKNLIPAIITLITGVVISISPAQFEVYINNLIPGLNFKIGGFSMFMFGITGDVLLKKIIAVFDKDKETAIGINKEGVS